MTLALPFVALHYWASSGRAFEGLAAHRLLAPDLAGFGEAGPRPTIGFG